MALGLREPLVSWANALAFRFLFLAFLRARTHVILPGLDTISGIAYNAGIMSYSASLGEFEQVILLAILRLGESAYAVTIREEIANCTHREPARGALYTSLDRLEQKGFVASRMGEPTPERGGRAKRFFTVTKAGRAALVNAQRAYQKLLKGLDILESSRA